MLKYCVLVSVLAVASIKASDETNFNITLVRIKSELRKSTSKFEHQLKNLNTDKTHLSTRISFLENDVLEFGQTRRGQRTQCSKDLALLIDRFEKTYEGRLDTKAAEKTIADFYALMKQCWEDLAGFNRYFACADDACRLEVRKAAELQLERAIGGLRVKELLDRINKDYIPIQEVVDEFNQKLIKVVFDFKRCRLGL